jgi:hypothetical protein
MGTPVLRDEVKGLHRRVVEVKTDGIEDYIRAAVLLTNDYVAPSPKRIEDVFEAENGLLLKQQGSDEIELQLRDLIKPRDFVTFSFDSEDKSIRAIDVASYLGRNSNYRKVWHGYCRAPSNSAAELKEDSKKIRE